ncbi:hypothetical protein OKW96_06025 [Sphingobacterium sp. KU25419]|nr:hypothetical protein OKW96_06025 [Sphingobacterium sp. KU25419]
MILPAQGWYSPSGSSNTYPYTSEALNLRGLFGLYWTSTASGTSTTNLNFGETTMQMIVRNPTTMNYVIARNIRCIAQ